tara:strand:- start:301 stop:645 length:345 start_codon:yes stop_codon:yes gene_type:complete
MEVKMVNFSDVEQILQKHYQADLKSAIVREVIALEIVDLLNGNVDKSVESVVEKPTTNVQEKVEPKKSETEKVEAKKKSVDKPKVKPKKSVKKPLSKLNVKSRTGKKSKTVKKY